MIVIDTPEGTQSFRVEMIFATIGDDFVIGDEKGLVWRYPADMRLFRRLTLGKHVVMGYKTFETMNCKPLPNRHCYVMTRQAREAVEGVTFVASREELLEKLKGVTNLITVIGGASVYDLFFDHCDTIYHSVIPPIFARNGFDEKSPGLIHLPINLQRLLHELVGPRQNSEVNKISMDMAHGGKVWIYDFS